MVKIRNTDEAPADAPAAHAPADARAAEAPADPRTATIRHLREAAVSRIEKTSLRGVAREIGMSPTGLKKFVSGTAPYSPTLRRLRNWYVRNAAVQVGGADTQDATAALAVLMYDLAPGPREQITREILASLASGYDESGKPRPPWLAGVGRGGEAPWAGAGGASIGPGGTGGVPPSRFSTADVPANRIRPEGMPPSRINAGDVSRKRVSVRGKYAHLPGSSEDFIRAKQEEIDREDGRAG